MAAATAATFSLSAGLVHFVYVPDHWWIWVPYGLFFLGTGLAADAARRPPRDAPGGAVDRLRRHRHEPGIICIYAISRTQYGAIIGPMRGHAELPGVVDMATTAGELVTVIALLSFLPARVRRWTTTVLLVAGAGLWWLRLTGRLAY